MHFLPLLSLFSLACGLFAAARYWEETSVKKRCRPTYALFVIPTSLLVCNHGLESLNPRAVFIVLFHAPDLSLEC